MRILFLIPYPPGQAPSQRFRFEQYLDLLTQHGHYYRLAPFLDEGTWRILYRPGLAARKAWGIGRGFGRRLRHVLAAPGYDYVFVHREAAPLGPPVFEWLLTKVLRKRVVYDFDDAIWLPNTSEANRLAAGLKWHHKVASICRWAWKNSCGNRYLAAYARQFNSCVVVNPTTIDTTHLHNQVRDQLAPGPLVVGWTGTHSTLKYLHPLLPVLRQLEAEGLAFEFQVISNQAPDFEGPPLRSLRFVPWRKETEIADLLAFHVGLMPLEDDPWAQGKCAFKALQYLALGIPALVSPVGMNTEVVQSGVNGYVCATAADWLTYLRRLLADASHRQQLGQAARATVEQRYSVRSNAANFLSLFT